MFLTKMVTGSGYVCTKELFLKIEYEFSCAYLNLS